MKLQNTWAKDINKNDIHIVAGLKNLNLWLDLKAFAKVNSIEFGISPEYSLGRYSSSFVDNDQTMIVFIGKDNRIIGKLDEYAEEEEMKMMLDRTLASFHGVYVNSTASDILLFEPTKEIILSDLFTVKSDIQLDISFTENSNSYVFDYIIDNEKIILSKTNIYGNSTVTLTSAIPGTDISIRKTFDIVNISPVYEDFEYSDLSESSINYGYTGDSKWFLSTEQAYHGSSSFKSYEIGDFQTSEFILSAEIVTPGNISFAYKTISQKYYDKLCFYIDGVLMNGTDDTFAEFSGEAGWKNFTCSIRSGTRTLKWSYEKDGTAFWFDDCAWVDMISFPPDTEFLPPLIQSLENVHITSVNVSPNPFNPETRITYNISKPSNAEISVYDVKGNKVTELHKGHLNSGDHTFNFNGRGLSSGIYYSVLKTAGTSKITKMMMIK